MNGEKILTQSDSKKIISILSMTSCNVVSFIGVLEHIVNLDEVIDAIRKNQHIQYVYMSVPMFSLSCILEAANQDCYNRHAGGTHTHLFTDESLHQLVTTPFRITTSSDRMGYRLEGPKLLLKEPLEMISEIAVFGTVQVPADGNPIILMADHQSIAGYPKIAQVVAADLPRLAQMKPGEKISFLEVSQEEAEDSLLEQERYLSSLRIALKYKG